MNDSIDTGGQGWAWQADAWTGALVRILQTQEERASSQILAQSITQYHCQSSSAACVPWMLWTEINKAVFFA